MGKIIALKGKGSSGKTTTIKLLPEILIQNGYKQNHGKYQPYGADFKDIFIKQGIKVGITSSGDTYDLVKDRLDEFIQENCDICICACRTSDRKPLGTIAATQSFSGYTNEYIDKTYAQGEIQQKQANRADALTLFNKI